MQLYFGKFYQNNIAKEDGVDGVDLKIFSQRMNHTPNYKAVCRTAPATPGLLIKVGKLTLGNFTYGNLTLGKLTRVYLPCINLYEVSFPG